MVRYVQSEGYFYSILDGRKHALLTFGRNLKKQLTLATNSVSPLLLPDTIRNISTLLGDATTLVWFHTM